MARPGRRGAAAPVAAALALLAAAFLALRVISGHGWTLDIGDAEAHLNIARRIVDSRTPGYDQIGTVWLPLPHLVMLPFVTHDAWWRSGFAGALPSAIAYCAAGLFFFLAFRRLLGDAPSLAALAVFALNPNLLYLAATPMSEPVSFAALALLFWATLRYADRPTALWAAVCGIANLLAALARYEGWFVIPFVALFLLLRGGRRRWLSALLFCVVASLGPLWWLAHNFWLYGDPLAFFRGPYSAQAIYQRALDAGMARYPGDHNWPVAIRYFAAALKSSVLWPAIALALVGGVVALWRKQWWALAFLALPPVFYVLSLHSGSTPIFLPSLYPFSYYNTRYALAGLPLIAFCAGAFALAAPARSRIPASAAIALLALAAWFIPPRPDSVLVWKEGRVNGAGRRAWTHTAAAYLSTHYHPGDGVIAGFGDLTGIFRQAGIPLRQTLHEGNIPFFDLAIANPRVFLHEKWAIAFSGDRVATAIVRAHRTGPRYDRVLVITEPNSPVVEIYRRSHGVPLPPSLE